nr:hypothetical protein [Tanacetum cinerariifolium]
MRQTIDSLLSKTINELTNQSSDYDTFYLKERIKEELRTKRKFFLKKELFKDMLPTEEELAYHKELGNIIDSSLSEVVLGKPFVQASKLTYDETLMLIRGFFNSFPGGKWLTFAKRYEKHIPNLLPKVITRIEGWKGCFFFVQDSIVLANCLELLSKDNRWDTKSFGDKLPDNINENCFFQRLGRYPISVHVYPDPIHFMAEMAFRSFMNAKTNEDMSFLPKESSPDFGTGSSGSSTPLVKCELAQRSSSSRATSAKTTSSKNSSPLLTIFDDDEAWKNHLDNYLDVEFLDLHDRCYARQAVVDNAVNRRFQELLKVIEQISGECDVMKERERSRDEECEGLKAKCEAAITDFDNIPAMVVLREKILLFPAMEVVSKVVPYIAMELVYSDKLGMLVGKIVSFVVLYGRCASFEEVVEMKKPFDLTKVKGYRPLYKEHTKARNNLATATFPFLFKVVSDPSTLIEALLLKKPPTLQRPTPSTTQDPVPHS